MCAPTKGRCAPFGTPAVVLPHTCAHIESYRGGTGGRSAPSPAAIVAASVARVETYAEAPALRPIAIFGLAILFTALAGVLIWLLMDSLSRSSIGGATWSLRGN